MSMSKDSLRLTPHMEMRTSEGAGPLPREHSEASVTSK